MGGGQSRIRTHGPFTVGWFQVSYLKPLRHLPYNWFWCSRSDSNRHVFQRQNLNLVRLPISPPEHCLLQKTIVRYTCIKIKHFGQLGAVGEDWTRGFLLTKEVLYHWVTTALLSGGPGRTWTLNRRLWRPLFCQLNYWPWKHGAGSENRTRKYSLARNQVTFTSYPQWNYLVPLNTLWNFVTD